MAMTQPKDLRAADIQAETRRSAEERRRRLRGRNIATLLALLALVVLFYMITIVRMGGQ